MRLGFAVKVLRGGGLPSHDTRRWRSGPSLGVSLERLSAILAHLDDHDIRFYRMATSLAPVREPPATDTEGRVSGVAAMTRRDGWTVKGAQEGDAAAWFLATPAGQPREWRVLWP